MGTIRKRGNKYYAEVCVNRRRRGKTCRTKAAAEAWIKATEKEGLQASHTFGDACTRYRKTYSARKRTRRAEEKRLDRLEAWFGTQTSLAQITPDRLAEWRDTRLQEVSAATVRRDWNLLNHLLAVAVREWEWLPTNPLSKLTRPKKPQPRSRVWSPAEVETYLQACGWPGNTLTARTGACLLFALETGMRASEITRIRPEHVMGRTVHVPTTKNGESRDVPLSTRAAEILAQVGNDFGLTDTQLHALFRKCRDRAALQGITFHDSRRTALTKLSKRLDALELARVSGHKDLRILLDTYYAPTVADLAAKLD